MLVHVGVRGQAVSTFSFLVGPRDGTQVKLGGKCLIQGAISFPLYPRFWDRSSLRDWSLQIRLRWESGKPPRWPVFQLVAVTARTNCRPPTFCMGAEDLNSSPHVSKASALPTKLSLEPLNTLLLLAEDLT